MLGHERLRAARLLAPLLLAALLLGAPAARAADCSRTSIGLQPLMDLAGGSYQGYAGGLYPGSNDPPASYLQAGIAAGAAITPVSGKVVLLAIGGSIPKRVFNQAIALANADPRKRPEVVLVNAAQGSQDVTVWANKNATVWKNTASILSGQGLTASQVRAVWMIQAITTSNWDGSLFPIQARETRDLMAQVVKNIDAKYPSVKQIHVSSLHYHGYVDPTSLRYTYAEPTLGHDNAWANKWLIEDRIAGRTSGPSWIGWNTDLWTDGLAGRYDGLTMVCPDDYEADGVHPSTVIGSTKLARLVEERYATAPETGWYRVP